MTYSMADEMSELVTRAVYSGLIVGLLAESDRCESLIVTEYR